MEKKNNLQKEYITGPKWSHDGEWLAYVKGKKQSNLELYRLKDGKKVTPFHSEVSNYQWSPTENIIAFIFAGTLHTFEVEKNADFENVSAGVGEYAWYPDGKKFLYLLKHTYFQLDGQELSYMKYKKMHI